MNKALKNIVRILIFVVLQVLIFKQISLGGEDFRYFHLLIYPVAIILLPIDTPKVAVLLIAFITGLTVDVFYDSPGLHASALVLMAFLRPSTLRALAPDTGYSKATYPVASSFGLLWYIQYAGILLGVFLFTYFSLEAFTFYYIGSILLKTIFSFIASFALLILHQILFNPKS
jgi:rod shape-determining protein MreD